MARLTRGTLAAALIGALALLAGGCGGSAQPKAPGTVSPTAYVTALCRAVAPFERDVASRSSDLSNRSALTATAGKNELVSYLRALSADSAQAVAKLRSAGAPTVSDGARFARQLLATFTKLNRALTRSQKLAAQLSTTNLASYRAGAMQLTSAVKTSVGALGAGLSTQGNKALNQAAAKVSACHTL
jgi:hypothetical protein